MSTWTTAADVEEKLRRRWARGELLRAHALGEPFVPLSMPLRGPTAETLADRLTEARAWAAAFERAAEGGRSFAIHSTTVGGRHLGRTSLPGRAVVESYAQAWRLLGVDGARGDVAVFDGVLAAAAGVPAAREWALAHPLRAIELAEEWPAILAAHDWLEWHRDSGLYLRQVDAPGVDTKLIERHRGVLAALLGVPKAVAGFTSALGLASKPSRVRLRFDPGVFGMPPRFTEAELRVDELFDAEIAPSSVVIVENEVTFLSVPVPSGGVVLFGAGYVVGHAGSQGWLRDASARGVVNYWGDLDTHGFQMLDRVRAHLPEVRSVLMDRETLLAHEQRWGTEPTPTNAALTRLTEAELAMYTDLVTDRHGMAVRLEQERIDWAWACRRLAAG
ncbi:MAG: hypothetical protein KKF42_07710 [Actinobacteria bacterium]|nr:hypothetical protein [Actinomycetota bacterium]